LSHAVPRPIPDHRCTVFVEPGVALDARMVVPEGARAGLLFCHPHPLHQGTMDNKVVTTFHRAFRDAGFAALRFDFRGNRNSTGNHDEGRAERRDVQACLRHLASLLPVGAPLVLGGYSFGSLVSMAYCAACMEPRPAALLVVAPPLSIHPVEPPASPRPMVAFLGSEDEFCSTDAFGAWVDAADPPLESRIVEEADHMFTRLGFRLREVASELAGQWSKALKSPEDTW
jgi:alpha/beta superfamily hydrolase